MNIEELAEYLGVPVTTTYASGLRTIARPRRDTCRRIGRDPWPGRAHRSAPSVRSTCGRIQTAACGPGPGFAMTTDNYAPSKPPGPRPSLLRGTSRRRSPAAATRPRGWASSHRTGPSQARRGLARRHRAHPLAAHRRRRAAEVLRHSRGPVVTGQRGDPFPPHDRRCHRLLARRRLHLQHLHHHDAFPMSVILPIIAALAVTAEWTQRSGLTTFTIVPHRGQIMLGKAVALVTVALPATALAFVVGAGGNVVASWISGHDTVWDQPLAAVPYLLPSLALSLAMGLACGTLIRNSAGAIVGVLRLLLRLPAAAGPAGREPGLVPGRAAVGRPGLPARRPASGFVRLRAVVTARRLHGPVVGPSTRGRALDRPALGGEVR
jgi:hypothetical protein